MKNLVILLILVLNFGCAVKAQNSKTLTEQERYKLAAEYSSENRGVSVLVMKGDKSAKKMTLHHYRLTDPKQLMFNGPTLASFDPKQVAQFLLFLHREADGRYSPVSGQTDPASISAVELQGLAR